MSADRPSPDANSTASAAPAAVPFATVYVTLTKQEHIQLKTDARYWKTQHRQAADRAQRNELRYERVARELKERAALTEAGLRSELETARALIRDLQKRVFGGKSERGKSCERQSGEGASRAPRGQRRGAPGHGRTMQTHLSERHEFAEMDKPQCPRCGLGLASFPGTEDAEVIEIEVRAYRRVIHRRRYVATCQCNCLPGIVAAASPARLINRGKFGVSVWTTVLLDKFMYGRPSHRLLQDLAGHGLNMSPATLVGGLRAIAPLFKRLDQALVDKLRTERHWHADETRWAVFVDIAGKVGHRWYLWVFHSSSVVHYVLDRTRASDVVGTELAGVDGGIISCDRYSGYKKFARLNPGVKLAFCWAHQRRDFLELANAYPGLAPWAFAWVDRIGHLYHLNGLRLRASPGSAERAATQSSLLLAVRQMAEERDAALAGTSLGAAAVKVLQSMASHWTGLTVFVDSPSVSMDNNIAERDMRGPVVGRKNFYGSGSEWSGELAAAMYSALMTVKLWGINARTWLASYLQACADNGNKAPDDMSAFLPWMMDAKRLAHMRAGPLTESIDSS
jgi:transposase